MRPTFTISLEVQSDPCESIGQQRLWPGSTCAPAGGCRLAAAHEHPHGGARRRCADLSQIADLIHEPKAPSPVLLWCWADSAGQGIVDEATVANLDDHGVALPPATHQPVAA